MSDWVHIGPSTGYYVLVPAESALGQYAAARDNCLGAVNHAAEIQVANRAATGMLRAGGVAR